MAKHQLVVFEENPVCQLTHGGHMTLRVVSLTVDGKPFRERSSFDYAVGHWFQEKLDKEVNLIADVFDCEIVYDGVDPYTPQHLPSGFEVKKWPSDLV